MQAIYVEWVVTKFDDHDDQTTKNNKKSLHVWNQLFAVTYCK